MGALLIADFVVSSTKDIHGRWKAAAEQQKKSGKRPGISRYRRR